MLCITPMCRVVADKYGRAIDDHRVDHWHSSHRGPSQSTLQRPSHRRLHAGYAVRADMGVVSRQNEKESGVGKAFLL